MICILCGISRLVYSLFAEACSQDALAPQSHLALEPPIGSCSHIPCSCAAKVCDGEEDPSQRIHKSDPQDISIDIPRLPQISPDISSYPNNINRSSMPRPVEPHPLAASDFEDAMELRVPKGPPPSKVQNVQTCPATQGKMAKLNTPKGPFEEGTYGENEWKWWVTSGFGGTLFSGKCKSIWAFGWKNLSGFLVGLSVAECSEKNVGEIDIIYPWQSRLCWAPCPTKDAVPPQL